MFNLKYLLNLYHKEKLFINIKFNHFSLFLHLIILYTFIEFITNHWILFKDLTFYNIIFTFYYIIF